MLPATPASAKRARDLSIECCRAWEVEVLSGDVALVVTELVANAVRHAGTDVWVRLVPLARGLRLEVADASVRPLRTRPHAQDAEGGRGLVLVDALATRYGVEADAHGKRVWAELLEPGYEEDALNAPAPRPAPTAGA